MVAAKVDEEKGKEEERRRKRKLWKWEERLVPIVTHMQKMSASRSLWPQKKKERKKKKAMDLTHPFLVWISVSEVNKETKPSFNQIICLELRRTQRDT